MTPEPRKGNALPVIITAIFVGVIIYASQALGIDDAFKHW